MTSSEEARVELFSSAQLLLFTLFIGAAEFSGP